MKISLILAHPDQHSFNHAIAQTCLQVLLRSGHEILYHDLYQERFDPILVHEEIPTNGVVPVAVARYCDEIASSDGIIIVHPNWWGQPPAILKGWIDRVIRPNIAYRFEEGDTGEGVPVGLLRAKEALVFNTSNTPIERELEVFGDPLERLWRDCLFGLCGVRGFFRRTYSVVVTSTIEQRSMWLEDTRDLVLRCFP